MHGLNENNFNYLYSKLENILLYKIFIQNLLVLQYFNSNNFKMVKETFLNDLCPSVFWLQTKRTFGSTHLLLINYIRYLEK